MNRRSSCNCVCKWGAAPRPQPPPPLYTSSRSFQVFQSRHRRIVSAKRGVPALLNRASPLQTSSCQEKQSPYERDAYIIIIRTLGLQWFANGAAPPTNSKKTPSLQQQPKTSTPPCSISKKQNPPHRLPQQQQKNSDSQRPPPPCDGHLQAI